MAKQKINNGVDETNAGASVVDSGDVTRADAPALVYNEALKKYVFLTPDGRCFNTRLKAENHIKQYSTHN